MGVHSREEQRSFTHAGDEECFVYARDRRQPEVPYFLHDVRVTSEVRIITREFLACPVPGCDSPRLKVVNRKRKRNGFSHLPGAGGHAAESMWHTQAKLMLLHWVHTSYPQCHAAIEVPIGDRERVADVLVTFADGQRVALEVQYSTEDHWPDRHASYQRHGISDVWLLGHRSKHLILDRDGRVKVTGLAGELLAAGLPLLWVNPDGRIATGYDTIRGCAVPPSPGNERPLELAIDPLDRCVLTPAGLTTPTMELLTRGTAVLEVLLAEEAAAKARARQRKADREQQLQRVAEERKQRAAYAQAKRAERHAAWQDNPLRTQIIDSYREVPEPLAVKVEPDGGVYAEPEHWHSVLYYDLIHRKAGSEFSVGEVYRCLTAAGIGLHENGRQRAATIVAYLEALHYRGLIRIQRAADNPDWITGCTVLLDLDGYHRRCEADRQRNLELQTVLRAAASEQRRVVAEQVQVATNEREKWDYPLKVEWDGDVNLVQHYVPGTDPVLRWHQRVVCAILHQQVDPTYTALHRHLGNTIADVPDPELHRFLATYTHQLAENAVPTPVAPEPSSRPAGSIAEPGVLF